MSAKVALNPGHDGERPEFMPARDITAKDRLTGRTVRETPDGPQNVNVDRIENLFARKKISQRQHAAANRLQSDWQRSQISPCGSTLAMPIAGSGRHEFTPAHAKIEAGDRFAAAKRELGHRFAIVDLVALQNYSIEKASAWLHIHKERGSERLETALGLLADHYRLPPDENTRATY